MPLRDYFFPPSWPGRGLGGWSKGFSNTLLNCPRNPWRRRILKVKARYFAVYREKTGRREEDVDLEEDATAGDLVWKIKEQHESLLQDMGSLVVAVNDEYVPLSHPLSEGDEVALIPPVSGG